MTLRPNRPPAPPHKAPVLAAIDVGTNAVRLEVARVLPNGALEPLHQERDPIRPGEGTFVSGEMRPEVVERLLSSLRRYAALCGRFDATVRAVATSAVRDSRNREEIVRRVKRETGLSLEVVSGTEEARLICLGVLHGRPASSRSLLIDIGGGSTELAAAHGDTPESLCSLAIGAVRITETFEAEKRVGPKKLELMRQYAREAFADHVPAKLVRGFKKVLGSSGTARAVVGFAATEDAPSRASLRQISRAVERLSSMSHAERGRRFDAHRASVVTGGAIILEQAMRQLGLESVVTVTRGLRDGVLFDLVRRLVPSPPDRSLADAALGLGRRLGFNEPHGTQTALLAVSLFDQLAPLHGLSSQHRPLLEAAALLHDVGHAVNYQRHHRHTYYLLRHADLPGVSERERELLALIARYHRRSAPEAADPELASLSRSEYAVLRKLVALLRVADALDRSHRQAVFRVRADLQRSSQVRLELSSKIPLDLELWDLQQEAAYFKRVFGRSVDASKGR